MKIILFSLLLAVLVLHVLTTGAQAQNPENCLVATRLGSLQGVLELSRNGKKYCSYKGIPYSNTPKRFEESELGGPWIGIKDATKYGSYCPQLAMNTENFIGDENCHFVNIHVPIEDQCQGVVNVTYEPIPVMVQIHGGGYEAGAGADWQPKYIMDECTIYLSLNFRLSALGFLTTNDGLIPGNLGLKDIVVALKWTQKNIDSFGGNPNSVTLVGVSSGSSAISSLIASPLGKGLFHRAIAQSGSAISSTLIKKDPSKYARELAKRLKCNVDETTSSHALKECFLAADVKDIIENQPLYKWSKEPYVAFGPVVENLNATNPFLTVNPLYKLISGDFNKVPLIMGFTEDEGLLLQAFAILSNPALINDWNTKWEEIVPISFNFNENYVSSEEQIKFAKQIRNFYFGNKNISWETSHDLINLHSDRYFVQAIMDTVELHSRHAPVYPYVFTYKGGVCNVCDIGYPEKAVTHADDTQFLFIYPMYPEIKAGDKNAAFSERMVKLWTTFARTGVPSETWPIKNVMKPYKNDGTKPYNWYKIDEEITEVANYLKDRRDFWRSLGLRHYDCPANY